MTEVGSADEALGRAEELLERLKATRDELERMAAQEDAEAAVEVLTELADLSPRRSRPNSPRLARADAPARADELRIVAVTSASSRSRPSWAASKRRFAIRSRAAGSSSSL